MNHKLFKSLRSVFGAPILAAGALACSSSVLAAPTVAVIGDSIGQGVQAADAAWQTQIYAYGRWVAKQMGAELVTPYIETTALGVVGDTTYRARIFPDQIATNVATSGADVSSVLDEQADAASPDDSDDETDLVIFPRQLSQVESVEALAPEWVLCWIGPNDALGAALGFDALDASQLTPAGQFEIRFAAIAQRLGDLKSASGTPTKTIFANIPDVTAIGFLVGGAEAEAFLGFDVDLAEGEFTSVVALVLMALAGNDDILSDPDFVLDETEVATIRTRIDTFNEIIEVQAGNVGMPVVDINAWYANALSSPPEFFGKRLGSQMLGGIFSLDLVHPSNITHALLANEFIKTMNSSFGTDIPRIKHRVLSLIFLLDPSIDKDGDGKARGRLGVGLLESVAFLIGLTGDLNDFRVEPN